MTKHIEGDIPAFPRNYNYTGHNGMWLRDYFAAQTLPFVLTELRRAHLGIGDRTFPQNVACHCYRVADAMLAARQGDAS